MTGQIVAVNPASSVRGPSHRVKTGNTPVLDAEDARWLLNSIETTSHPRHARHLGELERAYPKLMIPARIGLRSGIADALASHIPVWQIKKTAARKAAQEVRAVANYVYTRMEIA